MSARVQCRLSAGEREELWRRWKQGQCLHAIAREMSRCRSTLRWVVEGHGGICPPARRRADAQLSLAQREEISRGLSAQRPLRCIARAIGKNVSSVSREVRRNGGKQAYRAGLAEQAAWRRARRPKRCLLQQNRRLCQAVARGLRQQWSPQQISQRLERDYPHDHSMRVSHETIYRSLFIQARGVLKKELMRELRSGRLMRQSRHATRKGQARGQIRDAIPISERPAALADRAVPGHWEGDLISGADNSHIATLVERHSRFVLLAKLSGKDTHSVIDALSRTMRKLPAQLRRSLTWDRGTELTDHKQFTLATDMKVYLCDPHSPWQRGSNENTNGLLRQYFPKGTDLSVHSQAQLDAVARRLNGRPRETLNFRTPAEKLAEAVALTG